MPPNQVARNGSDGYQLVNNAEKLPFGQRSARRLGDEDRASSLVNELSRRSTSAERFTTDRDMEEELAERQMYLDEPSNVRLKSRIERNRMMFSGDKNYNKSNVETGYEMKTQRVRRTYINDAYDDDSFV